MKNFKKVFLFMFIAVLVSCSDSADEDLGISGDGSLSAKVDNATFTSMSVSVAAVVSNGILSVQGSNSSGEYVRILISNYSGTGTYTTGTVVTDPSSFSYGTVNPVATWISTFNLGSGTIEITEDNSTAISGTFSFTGVNQGSANKVITEGVFSAPKS
jgi:hypothetical protein